MCNQIINQIYADRNTFTSTQKAILLALARFCREGDTRCYRSLNDLAGDTGFTRRCVIKTLKELRLMHVLKRIESQLHRFQAISTVYSINLNLINGGERCSFDSERGSPPVEKKSSLGGERGSPHPVSKDYNIYIYNKKISDEEKQPEPTHEMSPEDNLKKEFEDWWLVYPRKQSRGKAYLAFLEARKHTTLEVLILKAKSFARQQERIISFARGKDYNSNQDLYTLWAHTWLANHCWEDDYGRDEVMQKPVQQVSPPIKQAEEPIKRMTEQEADDFFNEIKKQMRAA